MKNKGPLQGEISKIYNFEKIDIKSLKKEIEDIKMDNVSFYDFLLDYFYGKYENGLLVVSDKTVDYGEVAFLIENAKDIEFAEHRLKATWYVARLKNKP